MFKMTAMGPLALRDRVQIARDLPMTESSKLWVLNANSHIHQKFWQRWEDMARIAKWAKNGEITVYESGMDCDCVQYVRYHTIPATYAAYVKLQDDLAEWADGPFGTAIVPERGDSYSRDLAAEAHEDGHPWVVYA